MNVQWTRSTVPSIPFRDSTACLGHEVGQDIPASQTGGNVITSWEPRAPEAPDPDPWPFPWPETHHFPNSPSNLPPHDPGKPSCLRCLGYSPNRYMRKQADPFPAISHGSHPLPISSRIRTAVVLCQVCLCFISICGVYVYDGAIIARRPQCSCTSSAKTLTHNASDSPLKVIPIPLTPTSSTLHLRRPIIHPRMALSLSLVYLFSLIGQGPHLQQPVGIHHLLTLPDNVNHRVETLAWRLPPNKCWVQDPACRWPRNRIRSRRIRLIDVKRSERKRRETRRGSAPSAPTIRGPTRRSVNCSISIWRRRIPSPIAVSVCVFVLVGDIKCFS